MLPPLAIIAGLLHDTSVPVVEQLNPLLVKLAGAFRLPGKVRVNVVGPDVGAVPILFTMTGRLLA